MEGTRHERVALVIVAYIIGFVTAFIAFGVNSMHEEQLSANLRSSSTQVAHAEQQRPQGSSPRISKILIGENGLFAESNGYERLLSVDIATLPATAISGFGEDGYFYKVIDALVSEDGQYAYYCEQQKKGDTTCRSFVYSLADDTLHFVKVNGKRYESPIDNHRAAWGKDSVLTLDEAVSSSSSEPWLLSAAVTASSSAENSN